MVAGERLTFPTVEVVMQDQKIQRWDGSAYLARREVRIDSTKSITMADGSPPCLLARNQGRTLGRFVQPSKT